MSSASATGCGGASTEVGPGGGGRARAGGTILLASLAVLWAGLAAGQEAGREKTLEARPATGPIVLDGVLDEESWAGAAVGTGFVQREPDTGKPSSQRTEVSVVFSPTTLYIGLSCYDDEAGGGSSTRRCSGTSRCGATTPSTS
jgi:hypothetical protein